MAFLSDSERDFLITLSEICYCNPFSPRRIELERQILGSEFDEAQAAWSKRVGLDDVDRLNVQRLRAKAESVATELRERFDGANAQPGGAPEPDACQLYVDLILYLLFDRYMLPLFSVFMETNPLPGERPSGISQSTHGVPFWDAFQKDFHHFVDVLPAEEKAGETAEHWLACFSQVQRAFSHIYHSVVGYSQPSIALRATIWESIFTHDLKRYRRALFAKMADFTTLVCGPSGTGKELVAQAVGLSRYIPFDGKKKQFVGDCVTSFFPLNLSALSPTLIESELFGHCKGAYTGAVQDRSGWLELCPELGTVFLDEIGELEGALQVKLLRVLQSRRFQRLGETQDRIFAGKVIAATNRNLEEEMQAGRFREDLYYRLCSDIVRTPSLAEQISDSREAASDLVKFIATKIAGEEESETLTADVMDWIETHLGWDYPWPGNIRELEQCVRNILIRREYRPAHNPKTSPAGADNWQVPATWKLDSLELSAADLLSRYCTLAYQRLGSYEAAAAQLGLDRRTVKSKVDLNLLEEAT
jgi:DNA-binding NtrC family response regulator